jgi:hypothetical protein
MQKFKEEYIKLFIKSRRLNSFPVFSKKFYFADNDVPCLEANKLPNGINFKARWSHMLPDINTFFFQIVSLSTWINLTL